MHNIAGREERQRQSVFRFVVHLVAQPSRHLQNAARATPSATATPVEEQKFGAKCGARNPRNWTLVREWGGGEPNGNIIAFKQIGTLRRTDRLWQVAAERVVGSGKGGGTTDRTATAGKTKQIP